MLKALLSFTLVFNALFLNNENGTKVDKIEYTSKDYDNNILNLNIAINSKKRDVVELRVSFYKDGKEMSNYYLSSLIIQGYKNTTAKIPIKIENNMDININVYSSNNDKEILDIKMPLYVFFDQYCDLVNVGECVSAYPSIITYKNNKIIEQYERISLVDKKDTIVSNNNLIPLNEIKLISNLYLIDGYSSLIIDEKIEEFDMYYNGGYIFPLKINSDIIISLSFENNYYIDKINGKTSEEYNNGYVYDNQIILPYGNHEYDMTIKLIETFISFKEVTIDLKVITNKYLIGKCDTSKYCIRRYYI